MRIKQSPYTLIYFTPYSLRIIHTPMHLESSMQNNGERHYIKVTLKVAQQINELKMSIHPQGNKRA